MTGQCAFNRLLNENKRIFTEVVNLLLLTEDSCAGDNLFELIQTHTISGKTS
jgi:hypothetical protein